MRLGFGAAAVGLTVALAAVALAQDTVPIEIHVDAKVVPNKAGTAKHPQAVRIESHAYTSGSPGVGSTTGRSTRSARRTCCPATGRVPVRRARSWGRGSGKATADDVFTYPKITVVNGGRTKVFFYTVLTNPARVRTPVLGTLTKPLAAGRGGDPDRAA